MEEEEEDKYKIREREEVGKQKNGKENKEEKNERKRR